MLLVCNQPRLLSIVFYEVDLLDWCHVVGLEGGRSQGQVTSSSEIGAGMSAGVPGPGPGLSSNKDLHQGT